METSLTAPLSTVPLTYPTESLSVDESETKAKTNRNITDTTSAYAVKDAKRKIAKEVGRIVKSKPDRRMIDHNLSCEERPSTNVSANEMEDLEVVSNVRSGPALQI